MMCPSERMLRIYRAIPSYPREISIPEIARKIGVDDLIVRKAIRGFMADVPICESDSCTYCYISPLDRKGFINRMEKRRSLNNDNTGSDQEDS